MVFFDYLGGLELGSAGLLRGEILLRPPELLQTAVERTKAHGRGRMRRRLLGRALVQNGKGVAGSLPNVRFRKVFGILQVQLLRLLKLGILNHVRFLFFVDHIRLRPRRISRQIRIIKNIDRQLVIGG